MARTRVLSSLKPLPPQFTDWASILEKDSERWNSARQSARNGPKILVANCAGSDPHVTTVDSLLAVTLTLRGADVHILVCDEMLAACWMAFSTRVAPSHFAEFGPSKKLCGSCYLTGSAVFRPLGLPVHRYGEFLTARDIEIADAISAKVPLEEIKDFEYEGISVGEHAIAGTLRYFSRGDLEGEPQGEAILRRYLHASMASMFAIRRLLDTYPFSAVTGTHGMYVPEGLLGEVARSKNIDSIAWADSYRKQTFIFSHNDSYHRTMLSEPTSLWKNMPWTEEMESEICEYLKSRWYGTQDWIRYTQDWSEDVTAAAAELGIDFSKPCIGLLTNVIWDAQLHYSGNAFPTMLDWTLETIKYFETRPDLQLIVRVHPAEVRAGHNKSRQLMVDEIRRAIPNLPKNVFVVPPDSTINTYAAMMKCDSVLIYGTKAGVELTSMGIPVIVAGEAWIRNKGLTRDAATPEEYFRILDQLPIGRRMSEDEIREARKYAYHFFYRIHIPVPVLHESQGRAFTSLRVNKLDDLAPGRSPGIDVICDGIIKGADFVYPAELYPTTLGTTGKFTSSHSGELAARQTTRPIVSVVMPAQNHAGSLQQALDTVYHQKGSGQQFELDVVLVDNASSGRTAEIAERYPGLRYIRLEKAVPLAAARNIGVNASKGKYVTFLDDDTVWLPERLTSHVAILEHYPDFGAVYGQFIASDPAGDSIWPEAGTAPAGAVFNEFACEELALPSFMTIRRGVFDSAGAFDESLRGMEYYDMSMRIAALTRVAFIAGPAGRSVYSNSKAWQKRINRNEHQTEFSPALDRALALVPAGDKTAIRHAAVARWFARIARYLDNPETADLLRAHVLRSLQENPWMMTEPEYRELVLSYSSLVLSQALSEDSSVIPQSLRRFCDDLKATESGRPIRRFLGDALTETARRMWARRDFKAATVTASYAICQDSTQIASHLLVASRRLIRTLIPAAT